MIVGDDGAAVLTRSRAQIGAGGADPDGAIALVPRRHIALFTEAVTKANIGIGDGAFIEQTSGTPRRRILQDNRTVRPNEGLDFGTRPRGGLQPFDCGCGRGREDRERDKRGDLSFHLRSPSGTGELSHRFHRPAPRSLLSNRIISFYAASVTMGCRKRHPRWSRAALQLDRFDCGARTGVLTPLDQPIPLLRSSTEIDDPCWIHQKGNPHEQRRRQQGHRRALVHRILG